ncbi:Odorant receptor 13a [Anthophora plagiata]
MASTKNRDIAINVTSFYMKLIGFWIADNNAEERRRRRVSIYTIVALLFALLVHLRDIYYTWGNFSECVYMMCTLLTLGISLFKICVSIMSRTKFLNLIRYAKQNFWNSNYDPHEQTIIDKCNRTCTFLICIFNFFANGTVIGYIIRPLVANIGQNESERILISNFRVDLPLYKTPYYEMAFIFQVLIVIYVGICYLCIDNFLCILNLHTATQFRILHYRLSNLYRTSSNERCNEILKRKDERYTTFKNCIQQHQALIGYCCKLQEVFNSIVLAQVLLFSLLICLDGYLVMEDTSFVKRLTFIFHISGCMCQLLMFTYSCDSLIKESLSLAEAAYNCSWFHLPMDKIGKMLRKDLIFVIRRSRVPCCLTACGFFPVSLETYTKILSTAVSYFTLLRNQQEEIIET